MRREVRFFCVALVLHFEIFILIQRRFKIDGCRDNIGISFIGFMSEYSRTEFKSACHFSLFYLKLVVYEFYSSPSTIGTLYVLENETAI